jgi:antitoxin component of RelBE/YafQ-DinJ toxin-antitoxin module
MDTRIQFRVDEETKRLAQQMAESQGRTLSDACRELTEQLAEAQRKVESHEQWLTDQVNQAFAKLDKGTAEFVSATEAEQQLESFKEKLRGQN